MDRSLSRIYLPKKRRNEFCVFCRHQSKRRCLQFCGTKSGRDYDKAAETALTPFLFDDKFIGFEQAVLILACKKLYTGQIKAENFFDKTLIDRNYPRKDFHTVYSLRNRFRITANISAPLPSISTALYRV